MTRFRLVFIGLLIVALGAGRSLAVGADIQATNYVTRAELVTVLLSARSTMLPAIENNGRYADIPKGSWYEQAMLAAAQFGILSPDTQGNLRPMGSVSRAEFLKMLAYAFGIAKEYPHMYTDVPEDAWYAKYAGIAQKFRLFDLRKPHALQPTLLMLETEASYAMERFIAASVPQGAAAELLEKNLAKHEKKEGLAIYSVISTRKTNAILDSTPPPGAAHLAPAREEAPSVLVTLPDIRGQIVTLVNEVRRAENLAPLTYNVYLEGSAQQYAIDMAEQGFFGHMAPDGQTLKDRVGSTGYYDRSFSRDCGCIKGYTFGENIARGQKSAEEAMAAWMKSPSHKKAILDPDYSDIGVGVFGGLWVQHFGGVLLP